MNNINEMGSEALMADLYLLTMGQAYLDSGKNEEATFELFVRDLPENRGFLVAAGLEDALSYLSHLRYAKEEISWLRKTGLFRENFLKYLEKLRFGGEVWAVPEGRIVFPNEPLIRVTAPRIQAQIVETKLLNTIGFQTMIATKASRVVYSAAGRPVVDFSARRTHGSEAALKAARSSFIAGCAGTSNLEAAKKYRIPVYGTIAHSFVLSFDTETEAFRAYSKSYPDNTILLVDTFNTVRGIRNAILVAKEMRGRGCEVRGIRIDSGDLAKLSKKARNMLDRAGLNNVRIIVSGNLDEYKISELMRKGSPIDSFGVGTEMGTSGDAPSLNVAYKLVENRGRPVMKLSKAKATLPGVKQVFRQYGNSSIKRDVIALRNENIEGEPLLEKWMQKGRLCKKLPALSEIRENFLRDFEALDNRAKRLAKPKKTPVVLSPGLRKLIDKTKKTSS